MAILLKSPDQIARLREAGRLVAETYDELRPYIKPGVSTGELDSVAEKFIRGRGGLPIYKGYGALTNRGRLVRPAFPATICVAINDVICHGIPSTHQILQDGDIIGIDIGVIYRGWVGDTCVTFAVGQASDKTEHLLAATQHSLEIGIKAAQPGAHIGDIGATIQQYAEGEGYGVVREYGGHGVGRSLHEDPFVAHVGKFATGAEIRPGMVFTIEPMLNEGGAETQLHEDGWTVSTADGKRSAQFEHTIAITDNGPEILTTV